MVSALVLLNVERDKVNSIAETLAATEGITEVYSVAGRYDLAVIIRVKQNEQLADVVTKKIRSLDGIEKSETLIACCIFQPSGRIARISSGSRR